MCFLPTKMKQKMESSPSDKEPLPERKEFCVRKWKVRCGKPEKEMWFSYNIIFLFYRQFAYLVLVVFGFQSKREE